MNRSAASMCVNLWSASTQRALSHKHKVDRMYRAATLWNTEWVTLLPGGSVHCLRHRRAAAASPSVRDAKGLLLAKSSRNFSRCAPSVSFTRSVLPLKGSPHVLHFVPSLARVLFLPSHHPVLIRPVKLRRMRWAGYVVHVGKIEF